MSPDQKSLAVQQRLPVCVRVDVGRAGTVVTRLLEAAHELDLPGEEHPCPVVGVRTVKGTLYRSRSPADRVGCGAVEGVQALAGRVVVRIVVVRLVGVDALLVEEGGRPSVFDDKRYVGLEAE